MDVYLAALGCRLNEAELEMWSRNFKRSGHRVVHTPNNAHVMVLNTCAVTAEAARKSRQLARRLHRTNPAGHLVVTGCYAQLEPEKVERLAGVDLVVPNADKHTLVQAIEERIQPETMPRMATEPGETPMFRKARNRAFVKVQDGCKNRCTFCIVTIARGDEVSRTVDDVIDEIQALVEEGTQEVVLTGVHLGGYGRDLGDGPRLRDLVQSVLDRTDVERLRLGSLEPWDLPDDFWELWKDPRLCPHIHLPLQSGSDAVLKRMARRCTKDRYRELVQQARTAIPDLVVTTDIIVGFPGETDEEWEESAAFIEEIGFGHIHIFAYSRREGTTAARHKNHLPNDVKRDRSRTLHALAERMKTEHLEARVGTTDEVLWETRLEPEEGSAHTTWTGYTRNYLKACIDVPHGVPLENVVTPVHITGTDGDKVRVQIKDDTLTQHPLLSLP